MQQKDVEVQNVLTGQIPCTAVVAQSQAGLCAPQLADSHVRTQLGWMPR